MPLLLTRLGAQQQHHQRLDTIHSITFTLTEVHKTWKVHHHQLIGIPLIGLGTIPVATTSNCHLCDTTWRHLYMIHVNDKLAPSAHQKLLQHVLTREDLKCIRQKEHNREDNAIVQKCNEVWNTNLQKRGQKEPTTLHDPLVTLATALYKWGACVCLLCATPILSDIQQTTTDTQHILSTTLKHDHTPTSPNGQNNQQLKRRTSTPSRERELFIGTQFSILYTSMCSPAGAASPCAWCL